METFLPQDRTQRGPSSSVLHSFGKFQKALPLQTSSRTATGHSTPLRVVHTRSGAYLTRLIGTSERLLFQPSNLTLGMTDHFSVERREEP